MNGLEEIGDRLLVVFDGRCRFCNRSVRWFLIRDRMDRLRFSPSGSAEVGALLARQGFQTTGNEVGPSTLLAVRNAGTSSEKLLVRSAAVLAMLSELPGTWQAVSVVLGWIPRPLRDLGYRSVAKLRYRLGGRLQSCPIPTPEERAKFL